MLPEIAEMFKDTQWTEEFFLLINDVFDIMNARCPKNAINEENWPGSKKVIILNF